MDIKVYKMCEMINNAIEGNFQQLMAYKDGKINGWN